MAWVTGAEVLTHAKAANPSDPDNVAWAAVCAAAIDAEIVRRLTGTTIADDDVTGAALAIKPAALQDAAALYVARDAPQGIIDLGDGTATRIGADDIRALGPVLARYATPGIG